MLCIQDATQNSEVYQQAQGDNVWLGYSDSAQEGTWEWVDGCDSSYTNWNTGEPNDGSEGQDYGEIDLTSHSTTHPSTHRSTATQMYPLQQKCMAQIHPIQQ